MTGRERVLAASCGEQVDRQPMLAWLADDADADAIVCESLDRAGTEIAGRLVLADISNPFGLALRKGIDLNKALKDDPTVGGLMLDGLVDEVRHQIASSLDQGADGIFYRLHGASEKHCSPMQYGGHYLERDRELLCEAGRAMLNVLFVAGEDELYIDFVSDLPARVFAWDSVLTRITASQVRSARQGPVASADPTSEILLIVGQEKYLETLEQPNLG